MLPPVAPPSFPNENVGVDVPAAEPPKRPPEAGAVPVALAGGVPELPCPPKLNDIAAVDGVAARRGCDEASVVVGAAADCEYGTGFRPRAYQARTEWLC